MQYRKSEFFSVKKKPKESVQFIKDEKEEKDAKKNDQVDVKEVELEINATQNDKDIDTQADQRSVISKQAKKQQMSANIQYLLQEGQRKRVNTDANGPVDLNSLLRRWDVKFLDIQVENLQKESISIFLVFKIGNKARIIDRRSSRSAEMRDPDIVTHDKSFKQFKTEIIKDIEKESRQKVQKFFETELHASYNMLKQRSLIIEVWEYSRWSLNKFLGKTEIRLETIAQAQINQMFDVKRSKKNASFLRLYLTCYFQEIWDFRLEFEDLKGFNTIDESRKPISSYLKLTLIDDDGGSSDLRTQEIQQTLNPVWGYINDYIHFRGTLDDLTDLLLQFTVVDASGLALISEGKRTVIALRGIHQFNNFYASIKIKVNKKKQQKIESDLPQETEENILEGELNEEEVYTMIEGRINLNQIPRFVQLGELVRYKKDMTYLCLVINRVSHVSAPDDRGLINSYVVVQCGNETKQTKTIKDQMNPDFNEEMAFKIPTAKSSSIFDTVNIYQKDQDQKADIIREELYKRSEIKFQLWVEGNQITHDDNLGFAFFNISELAASFVIEDKEVIDFETKDRVKHKIKVGTFTKSFASSRFDASRITISFQVFFLPTIPDQIDLRDFQKVKGDIYPHDVRDRMRINSNGYSENQLYLMWEQKIKATFNQWNLKKNEISIFLKNIWVKDHYNQIHFVCKFIGSFSIQDMSYEADEIEREDSKLETMDDLSHYTRCIPYVDSDYNDVWYSPDFLLAIRRGTVVDHALLLACLFMGVRNKKQKEQADMFGILKNLTNDLNPFQKKSDEEETEQFPVEDRVFVALGTDEQEKITAWVMVYEEDFKSVTFWDVKHNHRWQLKNRIAVTEQESLKVFLNPNIKREKKKNIGGFFGFGGDKKERETQKLLKLEEKKKADKKRLEEEQEFEKQRLQEEKDQNEEQEQQKEIQKIIMANQREEKNDQPTGAQSAQKNSEIFAILSKEDSLFQNQTFDTNVLYSSGLNRRTQVKGLQDINEMAMASTLPQQQPQKSSMAGISRQTVAVSDPNSKIGTSLVSSQINDRKTFMKAQNDNLTTNKKTFLEQHKEKLMEQQEHDEIAKFRKVEDFQDGGETFKDCPFKSIQVLFNHKNLFANLTNQNPFAIFYHLHDPRKWHPYISDYNQKLGSFFTPSNPYPKMTKAAADTTLEAILLDVKDGVSNIRSNEGLQTQWKSLIDPTSKLLLHYARCLEYKDKKREMSVPDPNDLSKTVLRGYEALRDKFEKDMKNLIPINYHFQCLPMKFLFIEKSQIKALISEKAKAFFLLKKKNMVFGQNGKIFRYPNKVNCLRIVIAIYFCSYDVSAADKDKEKVMKNINAIDEEDEEDSDMMESEEHVVDDADENVGLKKKPR